MTRVLVLDLGTSYFKASVFDESGAMCALRRTPTPFTLAKDGRSEIDVSAFQQCVADLINELGREHEGLLESVQALTFASQTNSFVLLDQSSAALTPMIVWNDRRAADFVDAMNDVPGLRARTGVPELSSEFMVAKLLWLQRHAPDTFAQTDALCLMSDYFTHWLTGRYVTEAGVAGLTGLLDIHTLDWWPEMLGRFGINPDWLPEVARAGSDLGPLLPKAAERLGLSKSCRFVVGCLDQYAGAIGLGNVARGNVSETTGTVLASVRCASADDAIRSSATFAGPGYDEGIYYEMAFGGVSANLLERFRNGLNDLPGFAELDRAAAAVPAGANGLRLPSDANTETLDALMETWARDCDRGEAARAILEGVAFALKDQLDRLCEGRFPQALSCGGGAARSDLWLQIKADILNACTRSTQCPEPASLGAAMIALRALGERPMETLVETCVRPRAIMEPDAARHAAYAAIAAE